MRLVLRRKSTAACRKKLWSFAENRWTFSEKSPCFPSHRQTFRAQRAKSFSNQTIVREEKTEGKRERPEKEKNSAASGLKRSYSSRLCTASGVLRAFSIGGCGILGACLGNRGEKANFAFPFSPNYAFQNHPRFFDFHPLVAATHRGSARFVERPTAECTRHTELAPADGARL